MIVDRQCIQCGKKFRVKSSVVAIGNGNFCSRDCVSVSRSTSIIKNCEFCKKEMKVWPSIIKKGSGILCSRKCADLIRIKKAHIEKNCEFCGKTFQARAIRANRGKDRFCSMKCWSLAWVGEKHHNYVPSIEKVCICGKKLKVKPGQIKNGRIKYCSKKCAYKALEDRLSGENCYHWKGGITKISQKIRYSAEGRNWRKKVINRDNHCCVMCGGVERIEVDHIKPFALYPEDRFDVSNGRTLCHDCHIKTDTYGWRSDLPMSQNIINKKPEMAKGEKLYARH